MAHKAVGEHVVAEVLAGLVGKALGGFGRIEQREAQRVVGRLVPAVARVVEQRHAIVARTVGEVGPLVGIDLETVVAVVATAHVAQSDVVGGLLVAHAERELGLQQGIERPPVDLVLEVDARGEGSLVEVDALHDDRLAVALADDERLAQRAALYRQMDVVVNGQRGLVERSLLDFPGRPGSRAAVVEHHQAQALALGHEFATGLLVEE